MLPRPSTTTDFLRRSIRPKPDLYGPFWVCVTLVFSVAISGKINILLFVNMANNTLIVIYPLPKICLIFIEFLF